MFSTKVRIIIRISFIHYDNLTTKVPTIHIFVWLYLFIHYEKTDIIMCLFCWIYQLIMRITLSLIADIDKFSYQNHCHIISLQY